MEELQVVETGAEVAAEGVATVTSGVLGTSVTKKEVLMVAGGVAAVAVCCKLAMVAYKKGKAWYAERQASKTAEPAPEGC